MEKEPVQENLVSEFHKIIEESPTKIEKEFSSTENSWFACVGTRVFLMETLLHSIISRSELPPEKISDALKNLESLKIQLHKWKKEYPAKDSEIPEETKNKAIDMLKIF